MKPVKPDIRRASAAVANKRFQVVKKGTEQESNKESLVSVENETADGRNLIKTSVMSIEEYKASSKSLVDATNDEKITKTLERVIGKRR